VVLAGRPASDRRSFVDNELANYRVIGSHGDLVDEAWRRERFSRIFDWGHNAAGLGRQTMAIVATGDRTASLASVVAPTLVVHGAADTLVAPSGGEATARAIPGAELLVVPDLGHEIPPASWPLVVGAIVANARRADARRADVRRAEAGAVGSGGSR
ncbi:MAG: alpha/beta hydrolase, partial [Acidimicrobiales bacterium]